MNYSSRRKRIPHEIIKARQSRIVDLLRRLKLDTLLLNRRVEIQWAGSKPRMLRDVVLGQYYPEPTVKLEVAVSQDDEARRVLHELREVINETTFDCPILGKKTTVRDFFCFVKPIMDLLYSLQSTAPDIHAARRQMTDLAATETAADACQAIYQRLDDVLTKFGRMNSRLYCLSHIGCRIPDGAWTIEFQLKIQPAEEVRVVLDGETRRAYRCGQPFGMRGIDWIEIDGAAFGVEEPGRKYPVYVQSHVFEQLHGRNGRLAFIECVEWLAQECIWQSLKVPEIQRGRANQDFLILYRLAGHKVGYLATTLLEDRAIVRTFLFLTMSGTPEGDSLRRRLSISRKDREWLNLDDMRTFVLSDVQADKELVDLLTDCGCGELFSFLRTPEVRLTGYAAPIRKHLGMHDQAPVPLVGFAQGSRDGSDPPAK